MVCPAANVNVSLMPRLLHIFWRGVGYKAIRITIVALNPTQAKALRIKIWRDEIQTESPGSRLGHSGHIPSTIWSF